DAGVTLTLDGSSVTGGTITNTGATIAVHDGNKLTLSGVTISGGAINDGTAAGTNNQFGTIEIKGSTTIQGASSASPALLNNGGVTVDANQILTLSNVKANGTTFTDLGTIKAPSGTTLTLAGTDHVIGGPFAFGGGSAASTSNGILLNGVSLSDLNAVG